MDFWTAVVRIVEAAVWPGVLVYALWLGRERIGGLIDRVEKVKVPGGEASFHKQISEMPAIPAEERKAITFEQKAISLEPSEESIRKDVTVAGAFFEIRTAEAAPTYAVQSSWKEIEQTLKEALGKANLGFSGPFMARGSVQDERKMILSKLGLTNVDIEIFLQLEDLYYKSLYGQNLLIPISTDEALKYQDYAKILLRKLRSFVDSPNPSYPDHSPKVAPSTPSSSWGTAP